MGLAFIVSDANNNYYYDPSIYTFSMQYQYYNNTSGQLIYEETKELQMCQSSDFIAHGSYYDDLELDEVICPVTGNFTLEGFWDDTIVKTVNVYLYTCNNDTSPITCQSPDEITAFFKNKYLNAYYSSNIIDVNQYANPIQQIYQSEYMALDTSFSKSMRLTFGKVQVETDDGLIFPNLYETDSFIFAEKDVDFVPNNNDWIGNIVLYSAAEIYIVNRRYQKFQDAIAAVGGLANSLLIMGFVLTSLEKEFIVFTLLMSKLYTFVDPFRNGQISKKHYIWDHDKKEKDHSHRELEIEVARLQTNNKQPTDPTFAMISPKELGPDPFILEHYSSEGNVGQKPDTSPNNKNIMKKSIGNKLKSLFFANKERDPGEMNLSFCEFLKIKMGFPYQKLSGKEKMFSEAYERYPMEIDLIKIIQKIQEIDKLKTLLLNSEQMKLLNLVTKPTFSLKRDKVLMKGMTLRNLAEGNTDGSTGKEGDGLIKLQKYYKKILEEGEHASDLDKRLRKLVEEKIL